MELKKYQQKTLDELNSYLTEIKKHDSERAAALAFMMRTEKNYNRIPEINNAPFVCIKVPTGGGKTLIAGHSVGFIFNSYLGERNDKGLVIWFVPSDAIRTQTLENLRNRKHSYRAVLDERFNNAVKIFDLAEAKAISPSDLADNLCIIVATLSSFRRKDKEWLKAYQDNGALMNHFIDFKNQDFDFLDKDKEGEIIYSLVNVIKFHNPLIIADEGHNLQTELSLEMIGRLNPAFILEFTATPKGQSNVLVNISAKELKAEKMIKMPIYLANKTPWEETIYAGIDKLKELEKAAKKNKQEYVRPIMLLQAEQDKESSKRVYVEQIKKFLMNNAKIPEEQIKIKTAKKDELPKMAETLSKKSPIRYIITVNALKEGWDCPFAYILVSVSNLGARLSIEQTIGRIMRLPYAHEKADPALNSAYVFAATHNFSQTSEAVIKALHENGYEDILPMVGGVSIAANECKVDVKDKDIVIPYINIKDGQTYRKLDYLGDLIGDAPILSGQTVNLVLPAAETNSVVKIDIGQDGELIKDAAGKLNLIFHNQNFSQEDLLSWLRTKIQRGFISLTEINNFLEKVIVSLLKKYNLSKLNVARYQIKEAVESKIDQLVSEHADRRFKKLEAGGLLSGKGENFFVPKALNLIEVCPDNFSLHLYDKAGKMNNEELDVAYRLDTLTNVLWWFRNPEKYGFYLQGWNKNKFYPDFIAKTSKGNYFVLEYKGGHLEEAPEAQYKEEIGKKWVKLAGNKYRFALFGKKEINRIMEEISKS